jgi:hypothetical protein
MPCAGPTSRLAVGVEAFALVRRGTSRHEQGWWWRSVGREKGSRHHRSLRDGELCFVSPPTASSPGQLQPLLHVVASARVARISTSVRPRSTTARARFPKAGEVCRGRGSRKQGRSVAAPVNAREVEGLQRPASHRRRRRRCQGPHRRTVAPLLK